MLGWMEAVGLGKRGRTDYEHHLDDAAEEEGEFAG